MLSEVPLSESVSPACFFITPISTCSTTTPLLERTFRQGETNNFCSILEKMEEAKSPLTDEAAGELMVAIGEAVTNALRASGSCTVQLAIHPEGVTATISNRVGAAPAPDEVLTAFQREQETVQALREQETVQAVSPDLAEHGRGFFIIRMLVDDLQVIKPPGEFRLQLTKLAPHAISSLAAQ